MEIDGNGKMKSGKIEKEQKITKDERSSLKRSKSKNFFWNIEIQKAFPNHGHVNVPIYRI